ncbi:MAG: YraN family protein [Marinicella sp.]
MGTIQQWFSRCFATIKLRYYANKFGHPLQGFEAEKLASLYLQKSGLKLLENNFLTKAGEIDLVMQEGSCLVFIEVKYRASDAWANAAEAVTRQKQLKIIKAAKYYLQKKHASVQVECRFDVIAIDKQTNDININWLPHAFY